jgi:hypothetical protein
MAQVSAEFNGRRFFMQAVIVSIFARVAEMGVFFVAAAALTAGALAVR